MEIESSLSTAEIKRQVPYDAIVVLPYTHRDDPSKERQTLYRGSELTTRYRLSHFTARSVLAGWELYQQGKARLFVLPGEEKEPSTADLEKAYLVSKGVPEEDIVVFPNLNGTQQQLDPIFELQKSGELGKVLVVSFEFHKQRVSELMKIWGIEGDVAEVEETHVRFLQNLGNGNRVDREELINLPQLDQIKKAEHGIARKMMMLDRPFGKRAPFSRIAKVLMGPTVTDIDKVGLVRIEKAREGLNRIKDALLRKDKKAA